MRRLLALRPVGGCAASCLVLLALGALTPVRASAQSFENDVADAEGEAGLEELLALLEEETEIATKSRMNSDFVPGIVTVLHGDELEALGKRTVWEALALVPGLEAVLDGNGAPAIVVRGVEFPFNSGNVKIMVDSVPLSRESAGINGAVLLWPIEQVERIEFIRGPGSVIYGEFAFMGLVNIVPRMGPTRVHATVDEDGGVVAGARVSGGGESPGSFRWSAQLAGLDTDEATISGGRRAQEDRAFGVLELERGGFSLLGQIADRGVDGQVAERGLPLPGRPPRYDQTSWAVEARYHRAFSQSLEATFRASFNDNDLQPYPNAFADQVARLGTDLTWRAGGRQTWLGSVEVSSSEIDRAVNTRPVTRPEGPDPGPRPGEPPRPGEMMPGMPEQLVIENEDRNIVSVTLQDQVDLSDALTLTLGARWDDYDDIGDRVTPRLSLVWRAADHHIFKAQYAEGFRAPTFFELFAPEGDPNPQLDFEINQTSELNYVYRDTGKVGRITLFRTEIERMIYPLFPEFRFFNSRRATAEGVELEWSQQLTEQLKLIANASWSDTEDLRVAPGARAQGQADELANLALLYRFAPRWLGAVHWNHVGDRPVLPESEAYDLVDLTLSLEDAWGRAFGLRLGVDNALDDDVVYILSNPSGATGIRFGGRTAWLQLSWSP